MRMRKSYRYLANDERFDIESDSSKVSQLHAEKLVDNKYDAYKPQAYRIKLNKQESRQERCDSEKLSEKSNDDNLSVEGYIEKYSGGKYKVTSVKTESECTPQVIKVKSGNGCLLTFVIILLIILIIIMILNSVQVIVPLDATPEEVKEAFEKAFHLL
ncbi:hypothetical protein [Bacteroides acidifaciens]|jgi:hypothetical protein|uniref:Uncharacterized protein n=2 Tax=Bacteroides acidifaciens TaxID=85831 RepID=A0A7J0A047_9BACE|nr:hypothetical protein [Bacteroides acidifaciens]MBF0728285.1 hypothetical protein [Bacteroides acidifaciens]MBF0835185.1 hypothetical protein [Bacteroides acidifaciens]NDO55892.1 hypothetical protein [Bacteroides acidifaciens]TFU52758.1 hypothetical protein E4T97_01535 [Bacteroides acidifaciens]GFH85460.1 hypothetical protein IMSAGC001_00863 [Bacteroides acidifaciens]